MTEIIKKNKVLSETQVAAVKAFIRSIESSLNPPSGTTAVDFEAWSKWLQDQMLYFDYKSPTVDLLRKAYKKFFIKI